MNRQSQLAGTVRMMFRAPASKHAPVLSTDASYQQSSSSSDIPDVDFTVLCVSGMASECVESSWKRVSGTSAEYRSLLVIKAWA